ncbi:MAG: LamG domain-containing protein [Planctomycetota bacterium]
MRTQPLVFSLLCAAALPNAIHAQGLALYEPFDYGLPAGQTGALETRDGGHGWFDEWRGVSHPITALGSYWPLDGVAADVGPLGAHGVEFSATYTAGNPDLPWSGGALQLGGIGSVDLSAHVGKLGGLRRGTISVWVRSDASGDQTIFSVSDATTSEDRWAQLMLRNGVPAWEVKGDYASRGKLLTGGGVSVRPPPMSGEPLEWHHIAITAYGDGIAALFIDGEQKGTIGEEAFFGYLRRPDAMYIGQLVTSSGPKTPFEGEIDDLAIWGDALTPTEISELANRTMSPIAMIGPQTQRGPDITAGSLDSPAFRSRGLSPAGGRYTDSIGNRAIRGMAASVDFDIDETYYLSFLVRRNDNGGAISPFELQMSGPDQLGTRVGWDKNGNWVGGHRALRGQTKPTGVMMENTTYFVVTQIITESLASGNDDRIRVKCYAPGETVHESAGDLSKQGVGVDEWNINSLSSNSKSTDAIFITLLKGEEAVQGQNPGQSSVEIDEIRVGATWDSVTRLTYGTGCQGLEARITGRPAIGTTFNINLTGATPTVPAFLHIGVDNSSWLGQALPFDLDPLGAPGCFLLQSLNLTLPSGTDTAGFASLTFPVPDNPNLLARTLFNQWSALDGSGTLPLGLAFSDAMAIIVQR